MKARMFQYLAVLSCCFLLFNGCQSGPFAQSMKSTDDLASSAAEKKSESDIQKKLRVAMAEERKKGRQSRRTRNEQQDDSEQLAEISILDQKINPSAAKTESRALPISAPQTSLAQADDASVQQELNLAYDADRSGNLEKAQGYYQRVLVMDPHHFEALHRLAIIEDKKKNYPAAEAYYLKALKLDPANSNLLSDIGYSYMLQGRDDYGEKYLREALKYQPNHTRSLDHLGWYYGRTGQYDQALALFRMTSGEAQARQKFAQLFPGVNPEMNQGQMNLAQSGMTQHNVQRVAPANLSAGIQPVEQVQTEQQQPIQYATGQNGIEQYQAQPAAPAMNPAGLNPTQQIAEMMRRERDKAVQTRGAVQELPAISPQRSMMPQTASAPQNPLPYQENPQHLVHAPQPAPVQYVDPDAQIQAWPPAGDPGISQAVDASNYWAMKEQQQNQPVQQAPQNQYQNQQYQNQPGQGFPQAQQGQYQNMSGQQMPQQSRPVNMPQAGQPLYGNQYQVPGQFPDYRINSTQQNLNTENQYSENLQQNTDQAQLQEAARAGMNAGPGQMFPVAEVQQNTNGNSTLMSSQMQVGTLIPASAQVPQQNVYQMGGQNIRQVQYDPSAYQQQQAGGVRQAGYEYANQPAGQKGYQGQGMQPVQNAGGFPQLPSELPQSAMYSTNPAFAPANMRTTSAELQQSAQQGAYQAVQQTADQNRQLLMNPNSNQSAPSRFQWGAQPVPVPGQYSTSQGQY
ncbi:tetratricopeptide repeat protein [Gimesia sp.]|uniref:tetratricopeptide repeat protein n=1 Tax=Gimesia sp. TaxID=2024833 RepID=UPI003A92E5C2